MLDSTLWVGRQFPHVPEALRRWHCRSNRRRPERCQLAKAAQSRQKYCRDWQATELLLDGLPVPPVSTAPVTACPALDAALQAIANAAEAGGPPKEKQANRVQIPPPLATSFRRQSQPRPSAFELQSALHIFRRRPPNFELVAQMLRTHTGALPAATVHRKNQAPLRPLRIHERPLHQALSLL